MMVAMLWSAVGVLASRAQAEEGQTMAEYGILLGVIVIVVVAVAVLLGPTISDLFNAASRQL